MTKLLVFFLIFGVCIASIQSRKLSKKHDHSHHTQLYNVLDYGAIGDGHKDDTKAFDDAWEATCKSGKNSPVMYIPGGRNFLLQPVIFKGECRSKNVIIQIEGEIVAPSNPNDWKCHKNHCEEWITLDGVSGVYIHGFGTINGEGTNWWNLNCKKNKSKCKKKKATGLVISHSRNVYINDLNFKNSPQMHIAIERSSWIYASNLSIQAPGNSPNTDGIHLQHATHIFINNSTIRTGDDCISISDGSAHINISGITCGPGHGISIGSLGINGKEETVEFVHVKNSTFIETTNGVRIKTWQGGKGYGRHIIFEDIISQNVSNPIIIDQYYCPHKHCSNKKSAVQINNITYSNIHGTSNTQEAVNLACSESVPCSDILMKDINLESSAISEESGSSKFSGNGNSTISFCLNAHGHSHGHVFPSVPCLENI